MSDPEIPISNQQVTYDAILPKVYTHMSEYLYPYFTPYSHYTYKLGNINNYSIGSILGSGKFSTVFKGTDGKHVYAMKVYKDVRPNYIRREIFMHKALRKCEHIVQLHDVVRDPVSKSTTLLLEYHKSGNWKNFFPKMKISDIKNFMYKLLLALDECHSHGIMHRDVKQQNILYNPKTGDLHLGDLGLAEVYFPYHQYEVGIGTIRFMAPEILMSYRFYNYAIDIWSAGVILAEMIHEEPLFKGDYQLDILRSISRVFTASPLLEFADKIGFEVSTNLLNALSSISIGQFDAILSRVRDEYKDDDLFDLLRLMLVIDPTYRITARDALNHKFFDDVRKNKSNSK
ncbi:CMGC family protein kinase [Trichomonas vaginalis G3]|uniref:non-specific serine/threonine protein kinase n=1 Tax=Trichomonas vaginalis (strain ATCC PRA-98 / G3) TaxID=412133 RepID=A2FAQ3_TRIV3|nr:protein serine/threonine kinase protein [Trichomonas vaginalis G3]EAX98039.1 CMGC family protein kinase [Trichomonas vaginalis G3]KAI5528574.1 protein serine/threonine kinase protein [Trichomonas vaginalis G3]|eukprot:XP_001310969.1 CMGC family protein kinase [Trichomonas vaginalis G3]